jgi:methionine-rich copper-binding protein CopC
MLRMMSLAAAAMVLAGSAAADAHALLQKAFPPVGGTVATPPAELWLRFSEAVEPAFCTVTVRDAAGADFVAGRPHTAPDNGRQLVVGLKRLPPGDYAVAWHATSVDTHKTEGTYHFAVAP